VYTLLSLPYSAWPEEITSTCLTIKVGKTLGSRISLHMVLCNLTWILLKSELAQDQTHCHHREPSAPLSWLWRSLPLLPPGLQDEL
jgi:hypothetical protein